MSDGQPSPRAIAIVQLSGNQWIGQRHTPELGRTAVLLGSVAELGLEQACGRWARALRRRGWLLTADWSTTQTRRWASVPIRPLAELLHQQLLLGPPAQDWPRLRAIPLRRRDAR